ncbi:MAG TPA: hypothetical protein VN878_02560, partial [Usitatibacter sp.]|nr:hypothetical protein [Usitatibacter sp.]
MVAKFRNCVVPLAILLITLGVRAETTAAAIYYPGPLWQHRTPAQAGLDPERLKGAVEFAIANEARAPRDLTL